MKDDIVLAEIGCECADWMKDERVFWLDEGMREFWLEYRVLAGRRIKDCLLASGIMTVLAGKVAKRGERVWLEEGDRLRA
jgi:hypothetical protein